MQEFGLWLKLGVQHISDVDGYDHMLFLLVLCAPYGFKQLKALIWLITGFTIGHSLALAFSVLGIVKLPSAWVELAIAITILITALMAIIQQRKISERPLLPSILLVVFFGLIHGLGFSTLLNGLLSNGQGIAMPLLAFNLGLELGQLLIVAVILALMWLFERYFHFTQQLQLRFYGILAAFISLGMAWVRLSLLMN